MIRWFVLAGLLAPAARAQTPSGAPELVLGPAVASTQPADQDCMRVQAGLAVSYACINRQQRALVERHQAQLAGGVPGPRTPAPALGIYNRAATQEHLAAPFGSSVAPPHAPSLSYTNPLIAH